MMGGVHALWRRRPRYKSKAGPDTVAERLGGCKKVGKKEWVNISNKGGKFLKKLWCCVGGSITR